jgi:hypothetical protein
LSELHFPAGGIIHCETIGIGMSEERDQLIEHAPPAVNVFRRVASRGVMADGVLVALRLTGAQRLRQRAPVRKDVDAEVLEFAADVARLAAVEVEGRLDGVAVLGLKTRWDVCCGSKSTKLTVSLRFRLSGAESENAIDRKADC